MEGASGGLLQVHVHLFIRASYLIHVFKLCFHICYFSFFKRVTYQWGPCLAPKLEMYLGFGMENICSVVCDCWAFLEVLCILRVLTPALRCLEPELPQILFCNTYRFSSVMALVLLAPPQPFLMCTAVLHTPLFCTLKLQLIPYWALPLACVTK